MASEPSDIDTIDDAARYLYGLETGEFVASRNELVKAIRAAGDRELAGEVKALRKPSVVAAELNRVLRADPAGLDELLARAGELVSGHRSVLDGDAADIASLQAAHRQAAAKLAEGTSRSLDELAPLLEAASLDEDYHDALRSATFAVEPTPAAGFDLFSPLSGGATVTSLAEVRAKRRTAREEPPRPPRDDPAPDPALVRRRAEKALTSAEAERDRAARALELAGRRTAAAETKAAKAAARVAEIERRLSEAKANAADADASVLAARDAVERAEAALAVSEEAVGHAEGALADL